MLIIKVAIKSLVTTTLTIIITVPINITATKILEAGTKINTKNDKIFYDLKRRISIIVMMLKTVMVVVVIVFSTIVILKQLK